MYTKLVKFIVANRIAIQLSESIRLAIKLVAKLAYAIIGYKKNLLAYKIVIGNY